MPPFWAQLAPYARFGLLGTPEVQTSAVQSRLSAGRSASTLMTRPWRSQTSCWQSPAVWAAVGVPCGAKLTPHAPFVQTRTAQSLSLPGQSAPVRHDTQWPAPSHSVPPESPQLVRAGEGGFDGTPFVQTSSVQASPSTGRSPSSATLTRVPAPSQRLARQSPAVCG